jgi:hypothetical protein
MIDVFTSTMVPFVVFFSISIGKKVGNLVVISYAWYSRWCNVVDGDLTAFL